MTTLTGTTGADVAWVCPPEWDILPADYTRWRLLDDADQASGWLSRHDNPLTSPTGVLAQVAAGAPVTWYGLATAHPNPALLALGLAIQVGVAAYSGPRLHRIRSRATARAKLAQLPANHAFHALPVPAVPEVRDGRTRDEALEDAWRVGLAEAARRERAALEAERAARAQAKADAVAAKTASKDRRIKELQKALKKKILLDNPAPAAAPLPPRASTMLAHAAARHERVRAAWTDVISDPLNALDHASLFDITDERTASFITAYGELEDLVAVHPTGIPLAMADDYAAKTRACERLWNDAWAYSTKRGYDFLPAAERRLAKKASALLARAADESAARPERAAAARKATSLLSQISTVTLPEPSLTSIDSLTRLAITA